MAKDKNDFKVPNTFYLLDLHPSRSKLILKLIIICKPTALYCWGGGVYLNNLEVILDSLLLSQKGSCLSQKSLETKCTSYLRWVIAVPTGGSSTASTSYQLNALLTCWTSGSSSQSRNLVIFSNVILDCIIKTTLSEIINLENKKNICFQLLSSQYSEII